MRARKAGPHVIDYFAIALTHGLIALAIWRLLERPDLDDDALASEEQAKPKPKPWLAARAEAAGSEDGGADHG
jgi:hypothetical protein